MHALGWGLKRIAMEFGCSKNTVRRYVAADGWMAYSRRSGGGRLEEQEAWLKERFFPRVRPASSQADPSEADDAGALMITLTGDPGSRCHLIDDEPHRSSSSTCAAKLTHAPVTRPRR